MPRPTINNHIHGLRFIAIQLLALFFLFQHAAAQNGAEMVHFGDTVDVDVVGSFEFDWRGGITPEGFLDGYDVIEERIPAICRTEANVADSIAKELSVILREPVVNVRIIDRSKRPTAFLSGAVRSPYRFRILREVRLNELIAVSGGITDLAGGLITIFRPGRASCAAAAETPGDGNGSRTLSIQISDLLKGDETANPRIFAGDIITVLESDPIYMIGGVGNPRPIIARGSMTLTRAVATAGGLSKKADAGDITIYRRNGSAIEKIKANLEKIEAGSEADVELKAFDIVEVAEKGGRERTFPPVVVNGRNRDAGSGEPPLRIID